MGGGGIALTFQIKLFKFKSKSSYHFSSHSFSNFCSLSLHPGSFLTDLLCLPLSLFLLSYSCLFSPFPSSLLIFFFILPLLLFTTFERLAVWRAALLRALFKSRNIKKICDYYNTMKSHVCIRKGFSYLNTPAHTYRYHHIVIQNLYYIFILSHQASASSCMHCITYCAWTLWLEHWTEATLSVYRL